MKTHTHMRSGISALDGRDEGLLRNATHTILGPSGSGKSSAGVAFLQAGLAEGDRGCIISHNEPQNVMKRANSLGWDWQGAISSGAIRVIQYRQKADHFLPDHAVSEFGEILVNQGIKRLVLDPVTPWLIHPDPNEISRHVSKIVSELNGLGLTTLCLSRNPVSPHATRIIEQLSGLSASVSQIETDTQELIVLKKEKEIDAKVGSGSCPRFLNNNIIKNDKSILRIWK